MKKTTTLLLLALLLTLACEQDAYEKGEGRYSQLTATFVEAHTDGEGNVTDVITDGGEHYRLSQAVATTWATQSDTIYRALLYYTPAAAAGTVRPVSLARVGVVKPHRPDFFSDSVRTDPVRLESVWVSSSGRYLNAGLYLLTGTPDDEDAVQTLGLVSDTLMSNADGTATLHLRLYHDQGGVPQYYSTRTYLSMPLADITADSVSLSVATYDGTVSRVLPLPQAQNN